MALADDIADFLSSGGITTTIYRGFLPQLPSDAVQIVETGGLAPVPKMGGAGGAVTERPAFQVVRRSESVATARTEMNTIWKLLHWAGDRNINGVRYLLIEARQSPFALPKDESNRALYAANFLVHKEIT